MKKLSLTRSFSTRISLYILLAAVTIFVVAFIILFQSARSMVNDGAIKRTETALISKILEIDNALHSIEVAVGSMAWNIAGNISDADSLYVVIDRLLANNPTIYGSAISFEPDFYPSQDLFFSPYAYRQGDNTLLMQLGSENYDYHHMDWYQIPKLLDKPYWSEPYYDNGGVEMVIATYSFPLHDDNGELYAIIRADISLEWLTQLVNSLKIYPNSYNLMVGRSGTYLAHPEAKRVLNETIFTETLDIENPDVTQLGLAMIGGEQGVAVFNKYESLSSSYVFYAPVERTGWSVAVVCTHKDVFDSVDRMRTIIILIAIAGLIMLLVFCIYIVRQLTNPLSKLAYATLSIANGNLNVPLPAIKHREDEMGKLYTSFDFMQRSLMAYIKELEVTTAKKERIESELRIASQIQMGMIPKIFPPFPERSDIDIFAVLLPAKEVGGDLYDFFIEDGKLYFTIGDVSGKGVPAALMMAMTRSVLRSTASYLHTPSSIVSALNDSICQSNHSSMFVTLFLGILDLKTGVLRYCNAGHNAPVLIDTEREAEFVKVKSNLILGIYSGFDYQEQEMILQPGSSLFLYTDGVTESENKDQELFSDEQLLEVLSKQQVEKPVDRVNNVVKEVEKHASGADQNDDITILCLRYRGTNM